eukprot:9637683-Ditylum_brightwellii.AAC.1
MDQNTATTAKSTSSSRTTCYSRKSTSVLSIFKKRLHMMYTHLKSDLKTVKVDLQDQVKELRIELKTDIDNLFTDTMVKTIKDFKTNMDNYFQTVVMKSLIEQVCSNNAKTALSMQLKLQPVQNKSDLKRHHCS